MPGRRNQFKIVQPTINNRNAMPQTLADRLQARLQQLDLNAAQAAAAAGVRKSFIYDMLRGRSQHPNLNMLEKLATTLKVDTAWLLHGIGEVAGEPPVVENPDEAFTPIPAIEVPPVWGAGSVVPTESEYGRPYRFKRGWILQRLQSTPGRLRLMHIEGDGMAPTLDDGDMVLVDVGRTVPSPPGLFVLHDGTGLIAKRLEQRTPGRVRVVSDNPAYAAYEEAADKLRVVGRIRWLAREL